MQRVDAGESVERHKGQGHPHALSKAAEWKVKLAIKNKDGAICNVPLICMFPFSRRQHIIFFWVFLFLLTNHTCMLWIQLKKMITYLKFWHLKPFVNICAIKYAGGVIINPAPHISLMKKPTIASKASITSIAIFKQVSIASIDSRF